MNGVDEIENLYDEEESFFNFTPLVDVLFNILIFFMLATNFAQASGIAISLPQTSQSGQLEERETLTLLVTANGDIYQMNGEDTVAVATGDLGRIFDEYLTRLGNSSDTHKRPSLVIKADDKTMHGRIVSIMDIAMEKKVEDISIATENKLRE